MSDADRILMADIENKWGSVIADVCKSSSVPPAFVAALAANESGGDASAKRFEGAVLVTLWKVLLGRTAAYGSIRTADLVKFITGTRTGAVVAPQSLPADAFQRLDALATSWGLTQIMGYHVFDLNFWTDRMSMTPQSGLSDPHDNLVAAAQLLAQFAQRFNLDATKDFSEMFRCWNTGEPNGTTHDPAYVPNGLARMALYAQLVPSGAD